LYEFRRKFNIDVDAGDLVENESFIKLFIEVVVALVALVVIVVVVVVVLETTSEILGKGNDSVHIHFPSKKMDICSRADRAKTPFIRERVCRMAI
jgi:hypothetical protein